MRSISRCFYLFLSVCLFFLVFSAKFSIKAYAVLLDEVTLTPEQTVALYGETISAIYYDGSSWNDCEFHYIGNSTGMWSNNSSGYYNLRSYYQSQLEIDNLFSGGKWLFYACPVSSTVGIVADNYALYQFRLNTSITIDNIAFFRQIVATSRNGTNTSEAPWQSTYYTSSTVDYSVTTISSYGKGISNPSDHETYADVYFTPNSPMLKHNSSTPLWSDPKPFAFCDVYLEHVVDGEETPFKFSGMSMRFNKVSPLLVYEEDLVEGVLPNTFYCRLLAVSCPKITDGYQIPSVNPDNPQIDYSDLLDDIDGSIDDIASKLDEIIANQDEYTANLGLILAKLDLIYQQNFDIDIDFSTSALNNLKNLFVPTSSQTMAFIANMKQELEDAFPAFYTAEDTVHDFYDIFHDVHPVSTVRFPGVSLDLPTEDPSQTANFAIAGQDVDLKPASDRLSALYDALALIIDIVCTLAVVNMLRSRFHRDFEGGGSD